MLISKLAVTHGAVRRRVATSLIMASSRRSSGAAVAAVQVQAGLGGSHPSYVTRSFASAAESSPAEPSPASKPPPSSSSSSMMPLAIGGAVAAGGIYYYLNQTVVEGVGVTVASVGGTPVAAQEFAITNTRGGAISDYLKASWQAAKQDHEARVAYIQADHDARMSKAVADYNTACLDAQSKMDAAVASVDADVASVKTAAQTKAKAVHDAAVQCAANVKKYNEDHVAEMKKIGQGEADKVHAAYQQALQIRQDASAQFDQDVQSAKDDLAASKAKADAMVGQARQDAIDAANAQYNRLVATAQAVKGKADDDAARLRASAQAQAQKVKDAQQKAIDEANFQLALAESDFNQAVSDAWDAYEDRTAYIRAEYDTAAAAVKANYDAVIEKAEADKASAIAKAESDKDAASKKIEAAKDDALTKAKQVKDELVAEYDKIMEELNQIEVSVAQSVDRTKASIVGSIDAEKKKAQTMVRSLHFPPFTVSLPRNQYNPMRCDAMNGGFSLCI
mmetsp:Transcript_9406/g.19218  ORF Transcript_9406/g.19218 Transcript_9406/m.19218 type:complete len:507 (+) Transcript_9406:349-1869(+)